MKLFISIVFLLAVSFSLRAEQTIYFFEGFFKDAIEEQVLNSTFWPKVDEFKERHPNIKLVRQPGEPHHLISALNDTNTIGIIWVGHPDLIFNDNKTIVSGHLKAPSGKYIPHSVFKRQHKNLAFISLIVCDDQIIYDKYLSELPSNIKVIRPSSYKVNNRKLVNAYSGPPRTFERIIEHINSLKTGAPPNVKARYQQTTTDTRVDIKLTDLFSRFYSYNLYINDVLVGAIYHDTGVTNEQGVQKVSFVVPQEILKTINVLTVEPEQPERNEIGEGKFIDDIILLEATWFENESVVPLIKEPFHLGDDNTNIDAKGLLFSPENIEQLRKLPVQLRATVQW